MSNEPLIAFVAPPFAGHLFPLLQMATGIRDSGIQNLKFYSTPEAGPAIEASGFQWTSLLPEHSHQVTQISDTRSRVGSNPVRLYRQFKMNLNLMDQLKREIKTDWKYRKPDLVIADFTVPIAGIAALEMGVRWWTSMPTPCVLETGEETPSYLGGWQLPETWIGRTRDWAGRRMIRIFKKTIFRIFKNEVQKLGIDSVYRTDGYERIYSPEKILGLGIQDFEFPRKWPSWFQFIGPLTQSPDLPHAVPVFQSGKTHVLVTLGTHLGWARQHAGNLVRQVASRMPQCVFHYSCGEHKQDGAADDSRNRPLNENSNFSNFFTYPYLPYDQHLKNFDFVIHHGGTGILYSCLQNRIPSLVWPQDYDQFDHAARLVSHRLGKKLVPNPEIVARDINELLGCSKTKSQLGRFGEILDDHNPIDSIVCELRSIFSQSN
ncbi:MAG: glycosyl transferase [Planctomycetota bacterium]